MHAVEAALVEPQHRGLVLAQGFLGYGDGHERVAVPVPADPAAEPQERRHGEDPARVNLGERIVEAAVEHRRKVEQHLVEEVQAVTDLVEHARLAQPGFVRLPQRHDLLRDPVERVALFFRRQRGKVQPGQRTRDAPQLGQDRAPLGLRGMRGENGLHVEPVEQPLHLGRPDTVACQLTDRRAHALAHGPALGRGPERPLVEHPHPLLFFGQVDQLEVSREGLDHAAGLGQGKAVRQPEQLFAGSRVAGPAAFGQRPHLLDAFEQGAAFLLLDRAPQQVAEKVDLFAERLDRCGHGVLLKSTAIIAHNSAYE